MIKRIELKDISQVIEQGKAMVVTANPLIEQLRCFYTLQDEENIVHFQPLLEYLDEQIPSDKITDFYLGQMVS